METVKQHSSSVLAESSSRRILPLQGDSGALVQLGNTWLNFKTIAAIEFAWEAGEISEAEIQFVGTEGDWSVPQEDAKKLYDYLQTVSRDW